MGWQPLAVSRNILGLQEQLDLDIWLFSSLQAIRSQHCIAWHKAQGIISPSWCWNGFISSQGYILFILILLALHSTEIGHFDEYTDFWGSFYGSDWLGPFFSPPLICILLIPGYFF